MQFVKPTRGIEVEGTTKLLSRQSPDTLTIRDSEDREHPFVLGVYDPFSPNQNALDVQGIIGTMIRDEVFEGSLREVKTSRLARSIVKYTVNNKVSPELSPRQKLVARTLVGRQNGRVTEVIASESFGPGLSHTHAAIVNPDTLTIRPVVFIGSDGNRPVKDSLEMGISRNESIDLFHRVLGQL